MAPAQIFGKKYASTYEVMRVAFEEEYQVIELDDLVCRWLRRRTCLTGRYLRLLEWRTILEKNEEVTMKALSKIRY